MKYFKYKFSFLKLKNKFFKTTTTTKKKTVFHDSLVLLPEKLLRWLLFWDNKNVYYLILKSEGKRFYH